MKSEFMHPMQPWPSLARFGRILTLPRSGLNLFVFDTGAAGASNLPVLLMVHGLGDEADTWRHLIEPLARQYRVIALDLPGFGRSDKPRRSYTPSFYVDTILALISALGASTVSIVGHSLGGMIAHALALSNPNLVSRLTLIDGCLSPQPQRVSPGMLLMLLPYFGERFYNNLRKDPQAAYATLRGYYADLDGMPEQDQRFLYQRVNERVWSDGQRDAYLSVLRHMPIWMAGNGRKLTAQINQCAAPTHVIWGVKDMILPLAHAQALVAQQPCTHLSLIPDAGHLPHQERPQAVLDAVTH
ncbi:MAG: alpha/beta hydrolase [Chloroflexi bacterium]|nr:alpha/beta hydrolase [Chloroflexota bacterium]MCL5275827.1 alpha/beta hydrolase [Chloroflexota bacterium]